MATALPPAFLIPATTSSQSGALRLETTTLAPKSAICSAIARPMPFDEPVMTAVLPVRSKILMLPSPPFAFEKRRLQEHRGSRHPHQPAFGGLDSGSPARYALVVPW